MNMKKLKAELKQLRLRDGIFVIAALVIAFLLNLALETLFETRTLIPMIFVLAVFLISWRTAGYFWGIAASLISVLAVNYAFTFPYYAFDLITPECLSSAVVMLVVATITCTLTNQIKRQEKIKAESERERMRANLLRAVSHDLRTPLTGIYGSCSALIENYDSLDRERQLALLYDARKDSEWLIRMVENLLSVTRIDERKVRLSKLPTVLDELLDAVLVKFKKRCPDRDVQLELPDEVLIIPMDAMLIEQVLINILENAVDHAVGMTELKLRVELREHRAVFTITDNGCGIPEDKLGTLFSGYTGDRAEAADAHRRNMGIGLSVCATIVRAHGSEIYAKNEPNGGASFSFSLEIEEE